MGRQRGSGFCGGRVVEEEELGGGDVGETIIRIYDVRKKIYFQ